MYFSIGNFHSMYFHQTSSVAPCASSCVLHHLHISWTWKSIFIFFFIISQYPNHIQSYLFWLNSSFVWYPRESLWLGWAFKKKGGGVIQTISFLFVSNGNGFIWLIIICFFYWKWFLFTRFIGFFYIPLCISGGPCNKLNF